MLENRTFIKIWFAWIVLGVGLLATVFGSFQVKRDIEQDAEKQFAFACDQVTLNIQKHLDTYSLVLRGGKALFAASKTVDRHGWRAYVKELRADKNILDVQGIGFAQVIPAAELSTHIDNIRSEEFSKYTVYPAGGRAIYTPVIYIEPFRDRNLLAFGFDMYSEPVRRAAMEQARDSGEAALSGKVILVQGAGAETQEGALMYVPVYRNGMPLVTVGQRRTALIGWVYSAYRMNDLMAGILRDWASHEGKNISLHIYDGLQATPAALLFDSKSAHLHDWHTLLHQQRTINFNGHQWLLEFELIGNPSDISYTNVWITLLSGLSLSVLLFGLMLSEINTRANAIRIAEGLTEEIRHNQALLKESEFRWKFALEGSGDGLWDWNLEDETLFFSKIAKDMLGFAEYEFGNELEELTKRIHPEDTVKAHATVQDYLDGKTPVYDNEFRVRCKDGSYKWIHDRGVVLSRGEDGKPLRMIGTHRDITERKTSEVALAESRDLLQTIIDTVPIRVFWKDLNLRFLGCNMAVARDAGMTHPNELIGKDDYQMAWAAQAELYRADDKAVLESGIPKLSYDEPQTKPSGQTIWVRTSKVPFKNQANEAIGLLGIYDDITERKQVENKLLLAASVFTHAREGIMITEPDGTIIDVNNAFSSITGYSRDEVQGCNPSILSADPQDSMFYTAIWRNLVEKDHWFGEIWNRRKDGEMYAVMQTISAVPDSEGNTQQYVALFSDITSLKEYEKRLEHIAHYDALTGLPNRVLLADRLRQGMVQSRRREKQLAVAFLDLDGFKAINDNHGHDAGDQLLISVASRMEQTLREGDTISRLGGDEFVAVLLDLADIETSLPMLSRCTRVILFSRSRPVLALASTLRRQTLRRINSCVRQTKPCTRPNWRARTVTTSSISNRITAPLAITKAWKVYEAP